jgi:DNA-directed RNA polymerase specialized sigma subunit
VSVNSSQCTPLSYESSFYRCGRRQLLICALSKHRSCKAKCGRLRYAIIGSIHPPWAKVDHRKSQVVVMRFFGGLGVDETAEVLKVSPDTVARDWRLAKTWLMRELTEKKSDEA